MPSWHPPDSDSGSVQDDESIIKVHNDAKTRFSWIWPFGIWTIRVRVRVSLELQTVFRLWLDMWIGVKPLWLN